MGRDRRELLVGQPELIHGLLPSEALNHTRPNHASFMGPDPKPSGRMLVIVYGGGNDLLAAVGHPDGPTMVDAAVSALQGILADLIAHGVTDILVPNLPDVGITPAVQAQGSRAVAEARTLSSRFDAALEGALAEAAARSGVRLH